MLVETSSTLVKPSRYYLHCANQKLVSTEKNMGFTDRGVIGDKWSSRVLWICAFGSAIGLYMVAVERQMQNRQKRMAEALKAAAESDVQDGQI